MVRLHSFMLFIFNFFTQLKNHEKILVANRPIKPEQLYLFSKNGV